MSPKIFDKISFKIYKRENVNFFLVFFGCAFKNAIVLISKEIISLKFFDDIAEEKNWKAYIDCRVSRKFVRKIARVLASLMRASIVPLDPHDRHDLTSRKDPVMRNNGYPPTRWKLHETLEPSRSSGHFLHLRGTYCRGAKNAEEELRRCGKRMRTYNTHARLRIIV